MSTKHGQRALLVKRLRAANALLADERITYGPQRKAARKRINASVRALRQLPRIGFMKRGLAVDKETVSHRWARVRGLAA